MWTYVSKQRSFLWTQVNIYRYVSDVTWRYLTWHDVTLIHPTWRDKQIYMYMCMFVYYITSVRLEVRGQCHSFFDQISLVCSRPVPTLQCSSLPSSWPVPLVYLYISHCDPGQCHQVSLVAMGWSWRLIMWCLEMCWWLTWAVELYTWKRVESALILINER